MICDPVMNNSALEAMLSQARMSFNATDAKMNKQKVKRADVSNTSPGDDVDLSGWA